MKRSVRYYEPTHKGKTMTSISEADERLLKAVVGKYPTTYNGADVIQLCLDLFNDKEDLEAQLKAKNELIKTLENNASQHTIALFDCNDYANKQKRKARSIVAMLFWKARKRKRFCTSRFKDDYKIAERLFRQAYAMLKENQ